MNRYDEADGLQRQLKLTWLLLLLVVGLIAVPRLVSMFRWNAAAGDPRPVTPRGELASWEKTTTDLFSRVSPSVVYLTTRSRVADPFYRRAVEVDAGSGSGFMWDELGHIVTNFHVLQDASSARVVMWDHSSYEASLVGGSPDHDLAVLRINAPQEKLKPVLIGESGELLVGQSVFAIGNPFGLSQTLTTGIVSAKSRTIQSPTGRSIDEVIQIDAAINPGNSGGPLMDSAGRLIGVNTAIYSPSGASAGVGFAIPIDTVNRVVPQIIASGRYEPPQLGIRVNQEFSDAITRRLDVSGVLIMDIIEGGGADQAGLRGTIVGRQELVQLGDVITSINGSDISNMDEMLKTLDRFTRGASVTIEYWREGQTATADVPLR
ncbi:trypsin-like peptidase domain-containing protein [Stieleria sp. JC731]|uniref:S1C family serine protease n=1 Tax=Pirellulaceae TaxID=2691357 RepID=UPI001E3C1037|nr:trypsin-like peptidase domain-containing protein [Stieleria sp. JC731]MCC9603007.1 trypsin-like peptidase domain-containing protein [Stieleria sp. JC731]